MASISRFSFEHFYFSDLGITKHVAGKITLMSLMMIRMITMVGHGDKYASITRSPDAPVVFPNNQIPSWNLHVTTIMLIIITSTLIVMAKDDDDVIWFHHLLPRVLPGILQVLRGILQVLTGILQVLPLLPISVRLPLPSPPVSKRSRRESPVLIIVIIIVDNVVSIHHLHHHCQPIPVQA